MKLPSGKFGAWKHYGHRLPKIPFYRVVIDEPFPEDGAMEVIYTGYDSSKAGIVLLGQALVKLVEVPVKILTSPPPSPATTTVQGQVTSEEEPTKETQTTLQPTVESKWLVAKRLLTPILLAVEHDIESFQQNGFILAV